MFYAKSETFRKRVAFFSILLIGMGIFSIWLLTTDFPRAAVLSELLKTKKDFSKSLETQQELRDRNLQLFRESKAEFMGSEGLNRVIEEREMDKLIEKKDVSAQLVNIVFKEEETWLYLNIKNNNAARLLLRSSPQSQIKIVQNGEDREEVYTLRLLDYPLPDIIAPQTETLGAIHFSKIDPTQPFVFFMGGLQLEGEKEHFNFVYQID